LDGYACWTTGGEVRRIGTTSRELRRVGPRTGKFVEVSKTLRPALDYKKKTYYLQQNSVCK